MPHRALTGAADVDGRGEWRHRCRHAGRFHLFAAASRAVRVRDDERNIEFDDGHRHYAAFGKKGRLR